MTTFEAFSAGKAARYEASLGGAFAGLVQMHLSRARWILKATGWPSDDRVSAVLIRAFGEGWESAGVVGEAVEA